MEKFLPTFLVLSWVVRVKSTFKAHCSPIFCSIPPKISVVRKSHRFHGKASAVLRVKPPTLKSRLHRGRLILREHLSDFAGGVMLHARESVN